MPSEYRMLADQLEEIAEQVHGWLEVHSHYSDPVVKELRDIATVLRKSNAEEQPMPKSCGVCGGLQTTVRGRYPGAPRRTVCPTCMADRLDMIHETSSPSYNQAYEPAPSKEKP